MKYTLAVFFVLSVTAINAQERMPKGDAFPPPPGVTQPIQPAPVQEDPITQQSAPYQRNNGRPDRPYSQSHSYRWAVTDWEQSPGHYRDAEHLTWWFIPRPRALILAICP